MNDNNLKWYFPKAENMSGRGENDPQKELFPGDIYQTMIRESIQNSLDHPISKNNPVRVEYKLKKYETSYFPYLKDELRKHIQSCYGISKADKFMRMLNVLDSDRFYMLEVADYNTIGMDYDYDEDRGRFKKFVRYTGDPNDVAGSGGSHGYGKITYFSVSDINTIIVSSMTSTDYMCTFEGVSRLATHPTGEPRMSYYDTGFLDKGDGNPVQNKKGDDKSLIPAVFCRKEPGTTVFIPFVSIDDNSNDKSSIYKTCCEAVLRNFFAAINDGNLEVIIDFSEGNVLDADRVFKCDKDNLEDALKRFFSYPPYDKVKYNVFDKFNPYPYWLAYSNNDVTITDEISQEEAAKLCLGKKYICFKKELPVIGTTSLFVNVDLERGNDLVLFMRVPRMVVMVQHNNTNRGYSAIFMCDDNRPGKGNDLLRNMEDAAHRTWSKKQLKVDKRPKDKIEQAGQIENEMRDYIKWCLDVVFPANQTDSDDIELDDFSAPLISDNRILNPLIGSMIGKKGDDDSDRGVPVDIHAEEAADATKSKFVGKAQVIKQQKVKETDNDTDITGGYRGGKHKRRKKKHHYVNDSNTEERVVRMEFPVRFRVVSEETSDNHISYSLIIHSPIHEDKAYLTLTPIGETDDKSCDVRLKTCSVGRIHENVISEVPLVEGKNIITFTIDNIGEYAFSLLAEHDVTIKE